MFAFAIQAYCTKIDQLFAVDMSETESKHGSQSTEGQNAWLEKARSTLASMQGEQRLRAFFNFSAPVSEDHTTNASADELLLELRETEQYRGDEVTP